MKNLIHHIRYRFDSTYKKRCDDADDLLAALTAISVVRYTAEAFRADVNLRVCE